MAQGTLEEGPERFQEPESQEVCCEIVPSRNIRDHIHKVSPVWPPKCEPSEGDRSEHAATGTYMYLQMRMYVQWQLLKNEAMNSKESGKRVGIWEGFEGGKRMN